MEVSGGVVCETAKVTDSDGTGKALVGIEKYVAAFKFSLEGSKIKRSQGCKLEGASNELFKVGVSRGGIKWGRREGYRLSLPLLSPLRPGWW